MRRAIMEKLPSITQNQVEQYQRLRALTRDLSRVIIKAIPRTAMLEMGKILGIERNDVLIL